MDSESEDSVSLPFTATPSRGSITLGSVNNTTWLLNLNWNQSIIVSGAAYGSFMLADLISLEIKRFGVTGLVKIDVLLEQRNEHAEQKIMSAYLENGQTTIGLYPFSHKFKKIARLKGVLQIFDFVNCRISDISAGCSRNGTCPVRSKCVPLQGLSDDFNRLLDDPGEMYDVTLKCGDGEIPAHRVVLSARSPVFAAMFRSAMRAGGGGSVNVADVELHVLRAMLKYVYSGKVDDLTGELAEDLLPAADKYELGLLKQICACKLKSVLSENNVFRVMVLGDLLDRDLKDCAQDFIYRCEKFADVESTEEWKTFRVRHPRLAMEVLAGFVKHLQGLNRALDFGSPHIHKRRRI